MAGTLFGLPLSQQLDLNGKPLIGAKLFLYEAGTLTPVISYFDTGRTSAQTWPLVTDSNGRIPVFWLNDGTYRARLTDADGVELFNIDAVLALGPSDGSGGGGGTGVDPTSVLETGALKWKYSTGALSGWVRLNGRTIGSATSGAAERANDDTQALFELLWGVDANLVVSGGRGISAAADWAANKTIALPDFRGRVVGSLDDMGNTAAGRLTSTYFGTSATALGAAGGGQSHTLTLGEIPLHDHGGNTGTDSPDHSHNTTTLTTVGQSTPGGNFSIITIAGTTNTSSGGASARHAHSITAQGGGAAHSIVPPMILVTTYIKL